MSSSEVNSAVADALREGFSGVGKDPDIEELRMSDGGEGMLDAFIDAVGGERVMVVAHDALMRRVYAEYGIHGDTAIVEIAQVAGLAQIEPVQRNPIRATSWGVGEVIMDAYRRGLRRFIVGLGGSATSDCGIGMLRAMGDGWKSVRRDCSFVLASDVTNPLCGENGAAHVFAPQKGADTAMVEYLDARARRFADASARHFGYDRSRNPGAGAAGGLGYAFMQFFGAELQAGAELLLRLRNFDDMLRGASLVVTGEGCSDFQTLMGKLPMRVLGHCLEKEVPVWLVSGGVDDIGDMARAGFSRVISVTPYGMSIEEALKKEVARKNIKLAIAELIRHTVW